MKDKTLENKHFTNQSTIYGPVKSWRFGQSLGVDPIFETSTCSFNCIYCQLGHIQKITSKRKIYVPTEKIQQDFQTFLEKKTAIDVLTYSGSGEPTLALNLEDIISSLKEMAPEQKQIILTNGTELYQDSVKSALEKLDRVIIKLDSLEEKIFQQINRPEQSVNLERIKTSIIEFKKSFKGKIDIQTMLMNINSKNLNHYAEFLGEINPHHVQLNTPTRPYPLSWHRENRGNHLKIFDYEIKELKPISKNDAATIENQLKEKTGLTIVSVYR